MEVKSVPCIRVVRDGGEDSVLHKSGNGLRISAGRTAC